MNTGKSGILDLTKYRNAPAMLQTSRGATSKGKAPMLDHSIPQITKETTEEVPYGYCHCGCGEKTTVSVRSNRWDGYVKGEPRRFIKNHDKRLGPNAQRPGVDGSVEVVLPSGHIAIIDAVDADRIATRRWTVVRSETTDYVRDKNGVGMHNLILESISGNKPGDEGDHIDRDGLNNRRSNLRIATRRQNALNRRLQSNNTSGFRGVSWSKKNGKWLSAIRINNKTRYLGLFDTALEAAIAYDAAAIEVNGEFAQLNCPEVCK